MRLEAEYKRTERSVRALENVVMPEILQQEKSTEEELAELEQEEAVRVRLFSRSGFRR
jgi:vacuolar-type H+-ATPase subunit D/Vma8